MAEWDKYLNSICESYSRWWDFYILSDVEHEGLEAKDRSDPRYQFDLFAQAFEREEFSREGKEERIEERKKTEKFNALEGLLKFAKEHVLLAGRPGSGKTTTLQRLLLEEAKKAKAAPKQTIPVLVELKYYSVSTSDLILGFLSRHGAKLRKGEIEKMLSSGRFLLLIDGLNELPSEAARENLREFRDEHFRKTPMIFTSRDLALGFGMNIPHEMEMLPLTEDQIKQFVRAYLPDKADAMLRNLRGRLRDLGRTPLFLMMLCSVFKVQKGKLPSNLGQIFKVFTHEYERETKKDAKVSKESRRAWPEILKHLAFEMMRGDEPTELRLAIPRQEAEDIIFRFLEKEEYQEPHQKSREFLDDLLNYHLIRKSTEDRIEFNHQLIQEYYAAEHLLTLLPDLIKKPHTLKRDYLNYLKWTEPLSLMLALVEDSETAVRVVESALEVDFPLAARLAGSVKEKLQKHTIDPLLHLDVHPELMIQLLRATRSEAALDTLVRFLNDENINIRESVVIALSTIDTERTVEHLKVALKDKAMAIRSIATGALVEIDNEKAVEHLIGALKDEDIYIRSIVAYALGRTGDERTVEHLIGALQDKDRSVRSRAARALGHIGDERAVKHLMGALKDEDKSVSRDAIRALGIISDESIVEFLIEAMKDEDWAVRSIAAYRLAKIGSDRAVEYLIGALKNDDRSIRWNAADALGTIGGKRVVEHLIGALKDEDDKVQSRAADALGKIGDERAVEFLIGALKDENWSVRWSAADALGKIGDERAVEFLIGALKDEDRLVKSRVIYALGKIGDTKAAKHLIGALKDEDERVRSKAAEALGKIRSERAVEHLIGALKDEDISIRSIAAEALGKIRSERAVEHLIGALKDEDGSVRVSAAYALRSIRSEKAVVFLIGALKDEYKSVRSRAAEALGTIGDERAVKFLIRILNDEDASVRFSAAEALGRIGDKRAVEYLIEVLKDEEALVRSSAADALGTIGDERAAEHLLGILNDEDWSVSWRAARVLGEIGKPELISLLRQLLKKISKNTEGILDVIHKIQERFKFYDPAFLRRSDLYVLHISDLHLGTKGNARNWFTQLTLDLKEGLDSAHPDAIVISGDVGTCSNAEEYKAAVIFIRKLSEEFDLETDRIVIVPGNHDLNWELSEDAYESKQRKNAKGVIEEDKIIDKGDIIEVRGDEKYKERFRYFSDFYNEVKDEPYPLEYDHQSILQYIPEHNLLILGLNSAWQVDHHHKSRAGINQLALTEALNRIKENYEGCLKIAVWHHPLNSPGEDRIKDHGFMELLEQAGFQIVLHGHVHKADLNLFRYGGQPEGLRINVVAAGTFGGATRPRIPWQYNFIRIKDNKVWVYTRRREEENGAWKPDAKWRDESGKARDYYEFEI